MQTAHAPVGADPNIAAAVLQKRPRAEVGESISHLIVSDILRTPPANAFIGGNPYAAVSALEERTNEVVDQAFLRRVVNELLANLPIRTATFGPNPQCS